MLRRTCIAIASLFLVGCGSSSSSPRDAGGVDGSSSGSGGIRVNFDGGGLTGGGGAAGTGATAGAGTGNTAGAMATGTLVFQGASPLLLPSRLPCTFEEGATGDRWCAFLTDSVSSPGNTDLFVVNVSKAAAGVSVSCGLADANCLKLTSSYFEDQSHPALFQGDTGVLRPHGHTVRVASGDDRGPDAGRRGSGHKGRGGVHPRHQGDGHHLSARLARCDADRSAGLSHRCAGGPDR